MKLSLRKRQQWTPLFKLIDLLCIIGALLIALAVRETPLDLKYLAMLSTGLVAYLYLTEIASVYRSHKQIPNRSIMARTSLCLLGAVTSALILAFALQLSTDLSRLIISLWFVLALVSLNLWRFASHQLYLAMRRQGHFQRKAAIYGLTEAGLRLEQTIVTKDELGLQFVGFYDDRASDRFEEPYSSQVLGGSSILLQHAEDNDIDILFIAIPFIADARIENLITQLGNSTLDIHVVFEHRITDLLHGTPMEIGDLDTISVFDSPYRGSMAVLKRTEDILLSLLFIMITALPMLVIYLAVRLTSKGPGIFVQNRYGLNGESIKVWKFRSMSTQDNGSTVKQATKDDPRITKVGRFIRRTSLDELPQFFNVLTGQMSIVGPRPHAVAHNEFYRNQIPYYMIRHKVKPGITGWAQVNGWRGETEELYKMAKRVDFDLYYIRHWSVYFDLKIIFLTVFKGFVGQNTY